MSRSRFSALALLTVSASLALQGAGRTTPKSATPADAERKIEAARQLGNLPAYFEPNRGQTDPSVAYLANFGTTRLFLTRDSAVFVLKNGLKKPSSVVRMRTVNAQREQQFEPSSQLPGVSNYFIGKDSAKWVTSVPQYAKLKRQGVYPGVDMVFYGNQRQLEYDFVIAPGADPSRIELAYDGVDRLSTNAAGDLVLATASGDFVQKKPKVYQQIGGRQMEVASSYRIGANHSVGFEVARYDRSQPLVIDPVIVFNAIVGSSNDELYEGVAVDSNFNTYVAGTTTASDFPLVNAFQSSFLATSKIFLFKLNSTGTALLYATYLGGENNDYGAGVAVDSSGNATVAGTTASHQFPVASAAQSTYGGDPVDGVVAKFSSSGSSLIYSTYLGGVGTDQVQSVATDINGNVYVTGFTSGSFPVTAGAFQTAFGGGPSSDCMVNKYNSTGALIYSSYLGGNDLEQCFAIAADSSGNAYVTGVTQSSNFFVSSGAPYPHYAGGSGDAFLTKINASGSAISFSTYLGGEGADTAQAIAVDSQGAAYITGITNSHAFPVTSGAYQTSNPATSAAFVTKFNASGGVTYSTYLSGTVQDGGLGIAVDSIGIAYVVGFTTSPNFPVLAPVIGSKPGASTDTAGFATALSTTGGALVYSTFIGGQGASASKQYARAVAVDSGSNAYVVGQTDSLYYRNTNGAVNSGYGDADIFVTKISSGSASCVVSFGNSTLFAFGSGTTFTVEVFAPSGCSWTATPSQGWITLSGTNAATGTASMTVTAAANSGATRTGSVSFSTGQSIGVTQGPGGCSYSFSTTSGSVANTGGSSTAPLVAGTGCTWTATSSEPWLTVTSATGSGNASIGFTATANGLSTSRTGNIIVNNATFTVTQPASSGGGGGNGPATVISANPAGGSGLSQIFTFTYSSPTGYSGLTVVDALINNFLDGRAACYVAIVPSSGTAASVYLVNDAGDAGGPYASMTLPGSNTVQNNQCSISGSGSSISGSGNTLTVTLNITFKSAFAGNKVLYLAGQNAVGNSGWQAAGTWNIPGANCTGPCVGTATPSHTNGSSGTFVYTFTDTAGTSDLSVVNVLINNFIDGRHGCYVAFAPSGSSGGTVYLVNDAGDAGGPYSTMTLPGTGTVSNSQCRITASGSSASASGTTLTLTLNITFTNFSGDKVMYLAARNNSVSSNWQAVGSITIP